jgi:hypothetical protein
MSKAFIQRYDGGIASDPRDPTNGLSRIVSNFDIITNPNSLVPYRDSVDGNSNSANDLMQAWCIALRTGSTYSLYGLGRQTALNKVRIFYKNLTTSGTTDLKGNGWTETSNNLGTQVTPSYNCFVYYQKSGLIYGYHAGRYIWNYDPSGTAGFGDTYRDLTSFTNTAQGIVHSKDNYLYMPYDNIIASFDGTTWTNAALTLPSQFYITSICEYNNYLAIACAPLSGVGSSRVYLWDRSSSLNTITENIDWGAGNIKVLDNIDGYLIGIGLDGNNTTRFNDRVTFRYYTGAGAITFNELLGVTGTNLTIRKQKINNRIYFCMSISINGSTRDGIWSFSRHGTKFNLAHERTPNNDTSIGSGPMAGFFYIGDFLFQGFTNASSVFTNSKTNDTASYTATAIFESQINPNMALADKVHKKSLKAIIIAYTTVTSALGQVVVKYKVDGASSYTTVATCVTTGTNVLEFKDAAGVPFSKGVEYEFRLESQLGATVISCEYVYDIIPSLS